MPDSFEIDDLDLEIITALQVHPRVSWASLGRILSVDPSTLSRRWSRLQDAGLAWTSCQFMPELAGLTEARIAVFVEIDCVSGARDDVVRALVHKPRVVAVQCTSGRRDLSVTLRARTLQEIDDYIQAEIAVVAGVISTTVHVVRRIYRDGASWRLPVLAGDQVDALISQRSSGVAPPQPSSYHLSVVEALQNDFRLPVSALQERVGGSLSTVSRTVDMLLTAPWVSWRVDFAYLSAGWSCSAIIWMSVETGQLDDVATLLTSCPQVRMCASVSGEDNVTASLRLKNLQELDEIEAKLAALTPSVHVRDRWIVPRIPKLQGHILDSAGRHQSYVPIE